MTLQLALKAVVNDLTAAPAAGEPPPEPAPGEADPATTEIAAGAGVTELAVAMGTFPPRAEPATGEPGAGELISAELAVAMGTFFERDSGDAPVGGPDAAAPGAVERETGERGAAEHDDQQHHEASVTDRRDAYGHDVHGHDVHGADAVSRDAADDQSAERDAARDGTADQETADREAFAPGPLRDLEEAVVAVVGLHSAGLPAAIALRGAGGRVIAIDGSASRLETIRSGGAELLAAEQTRLHGHLEAGGFVLTDSFETLAAAEFVLICVPTAVDRERRPDPEALERACAEVVAYARPEQTIVLSSTTHVGSTSALLVEPLQERGLRVGEDVFVAYAADRVDPGVPEHTQRRIPRVVGAVTERCWERASTLLSHVSSDLHRVSSPEAAEMTKLYESTFRAVNIALAFEVADACRGHGLDPIEVTDAAASKPFGFMAHYPAAGVGGNCIAVDPHFLAQPLRGGGRPATITEEALRKVAARPRQIVWRAQEILVRSDLELTGARVLVVGAAYKPGIADSRQSPAVEIITRLQAEGVHVDYHDPLVGELQLGGRRSRASTPIRGAMPPGSDPRTTRWRSS